MYCKWDIICNSKWFVCCDLKAAAKNDKPTSEYEQKCTNIQPGPYVNR